LDTAVIVIKSLAALAFANLAATPALVADLNTFRAQHGRPALSMSATLSGIA
jgi:hypothetical protein